jgi:tRNA-Thr(GGU) m(6)t(6)A37 methyltransferase TsaA
MMARDPDPARPGETTIALPDHFDAGVYFIGRIRTPWRRREDCPRNTREAIARGDQCTIALEPRYAPALQDLATCSHIIVLYWMAQARRDLVLQTPRHQPHPRGTFALRSPARPNPIALGVVPLVGIENHHLTVIGLDCLDGTPLLDLKPYFASTDAVPDAVVGWREGA